MAVQSFDVVGCHVPRVEGLLKATGRAEFTVDITLPGMLHAKILRSPHAHAILKGIDTSKAERVPGVKGVLTGKETAGIRIGFVDSPKYSADMPVLAEDKLRYIGQEVAAVAAVSEEVASEALELIEVEYEPLPAVFDPEEAQKPGAPKIHTEVNPWGKSFWEEWGVPRSAAPQRIQNNLAAETSVTFGNMDRGFAEAAYVREDTFRIGVGAHAAFEPHGVVAHFQPEGRLDVWLGNQAIFIKQWWLAKVIGLPRSKVRIHKSYVGGSFGGKMDPFPYEFVAAFLSKKTGRPVKYTCTREEVFSTTRTDHPMVIHVKTGVSREGRLVAQHIRVLDDTGAYYGTGPIICFLMYPWAITPYRLENFQYEARAVFTNNPVRGAKRSHGSVHICLALESHLDMIAQDMNIDSIELRLRNARETGEVLPNGDRLNSCGLRECLQRAAETANWCSKRCSLPRNRGLGVGVSAMFSGAQFYPFGSAAVVQFHEDGTATLFTGSQEIGQGAETTLAQIASEGLGITLERISVVAGDTELCPIDLGNFLSAGTFVTGKAVKQAADDARNQLLNRAAEILQVLPEQLSVRNNRILGPEIALEISQVVRRSILSGEAAIIGKGFTKAVQEAQWYPSLSRGKGRFTDAYSFSVTVAEVEVDPETGVVRPIKLTKALDCGYPVNPLSLKGQSEGEGAMGEGAALFEELLSNGGLVLNPSLLDYKIPGVLEMPEFETIFVETHDPGGPYGAKEAGEGSIGSVVAALANAVSHAAGVRVTQLPITPERLLRLLSQKGDRRG
ncbi:MAG: xanthine dehydrogenase family protein molybdopterin-binding subunit [Candidatus Binatia bacterium]